MTKEERIALVKPFLLELVQLMSKHRVTIVFDGPGYGEGSYMWTKDGHECYPVEEGFPDEYDCRCLGLPEGEPNTDQKQ